VIALDTNLLVYAHRRDSPHHERALAAIEGLAGGAGQFGIPWPCVHEFLAIATHPRIWSPPSTPDQAFAAMNDLLGIPHAVTLGESTDHLPRLAELVTAARITGAKVHDARIAAICLAHGVTELWTADRDFSYFPQLRTRNPLVA
jgi:uncharacterized protein